CTVKAWAGCLLAVASKRHRDILGFPSSPPGDSNDRRTEVRNPFCGTILCARKLATLENDRPSPAKPGAVENAIKPSQLHTPAHSISAGLICRMVKWLVLPRNESLLLTLSNVRFNN